MDEFISKEDVVKQLLEKIIDDSSKKADYDIDALLKEIEKPIVKKKDRK